MRNEFVILVLLCMRFTSAYITTRGIFKIMERKAAKENQNKLGEHLVVVADAMPVENKINISFSHNLENAENRINESEILNQGAAKPIKINERSFVLIHQKFKTPILNLFHTQIQHPNDIIRESPKSLMTNLDNVRFEELTQRFSTLNLCTPEKESSEVKKIAKVADKTQGTLKVLYCINNNKTENNHKMNKTNETKELDINKVSAEQREYLELLKSPLLRPHYNNENEKPIIHENEYQISSEVPKIPTYSEDRNVLSKMSLDLKQRLVKKYNSKHSRPYESQVTFYKNEAANPHEDRSSNFIFDDTVFKFLDETTDDDHAWNQLNSTLEGKPDDRKKLTHNHINRIHYCHDCSMKKIDPELIDRMRVESDCKCGRHVYLRGRSNWDNHEKNKQVKMPSVYSTYPRLVTVVLSRKEKEKKNNIPHSIPHITKANHPLF